MTEQLLRCMCGDSECPSCGDAQGTKTDETKEKRYIVHSAKISENTDVFSDILLLYAPQRSTVIDMTFGRGMFWKRVNRPDINRITCDVAFGEPDYKCDFRSLPLANESVHMAVLDPHYATTKSATHTGGKCAGDFAYGLAGGTESKTRSSHDENVKLYLDGATEARRILKKDGFLVLKTQDDATFFKHVLLMNIEGFICEDLFVVINPQPPIWDPRWKVQHHARKNHSYFIVLRKLKG